MQLLALSKGPLSECGCQRGLGPSTPAWGLPRRTLAVPRPGGRDPEVQMWAGLVSPEAFVLGTRMSSLPRGPLMVVPLRVSESCSPLPRSRQSDQRRARLVTSSYLSHLCKDPVSK